MDDLVETVEIFAGLMPGDDEGSRSLREKAVIYESKCHRMLNLTQVSAAIQVVLPTLVS